MSCYLLSRGPLDAPAQAWLRTAEGSDSRVPGFGLLSGPDGPVLATEEAPGPDPLDELAWATWQAAEGRRGPVRGFLLHGTEALRRIPRLCVPARVQRGQVRRAGLIELCRDEEPGRPWPGRWVELRWRDGGAPAGRRERMPAEGIRDELWVVVDPPLVPADDAALDTLLAGVPGGGVRDSTATLLPPWSPPAAPGWEGELRERLLGLLLARYPSPCRPLLVELLRLAASPLVAQLLMRGAELDAAEGVVMDPRAERPLTSQLLLREPGGEGWSAETWRRALGGRVALAGRLGPALSRALAGDLAAVLREARAVLRPVGHRPEARIDAPEPRPTLGEGPRWVEEDGSHQLLGRLLGRVGDAPLQRRVTAEVLDPARRPLDAAPAWDHHAVEVAVAERVLGVGADRRGDPAWRTAALQLLAAAEGGATAGVPAGSPDLVEATEPSGAGWAHPLQSLVEGWRLPGERFPSLRFQGEPLATLVYHHAPTVQLRRWRWMLPARCLVRPGVNRLDDELAPLDGGLWLE